MNARVEYRPSLLAETAFAVAGLLAVVVVEFDTLVGTPPVEATVPTVAGATVGTGLLLVATSRTVKGLDRRRLVRVVTVVAAVVGGAALLTAVGEPDATFGLFGFFLAFGTGLVVLRTRYGYR